MTLSGELPIVNHETIIASVDRETAALLSSLLGGFLEIDLQGQPVLDEFTGGHVLTYLAREADRMADELLAATGRPVPPLDADRRWDVEQGGLRPGAVLIEDFVEASSRLTDAMEGVHDWSTLNATVSEIPGGRLVQLLVHHADLNRPWDSVPEQDARMALSQLPTIMPTELGDIRLVARSGQAPIVIHPNLVQTVIEGDPRALLSWASGRGDSTDANLPPISRRVWF